jgi:hypothetical protein
VNGFVVHPDSGFQDAAAIANDTIAPNDTADDIEKMGIRSDYQLTYISSGQPSQVSTEVALFGSAEEAASFVATEVGDAEQYEGTKLARVHPGDILALARTMAKRMEAGR